MAEPLAARGDDDGDGRLDGQGMNHAAAPAPLVEEEQLAPLLEHDHREALTQEASVFGSFLVNNAGMRRVWLVLMYFTVYFATCLCARALAMSYNLNATVGISYACWAVFVAIAISVVAYLICVLNWHQDIAVLDAAGNNKIFYIFYIVVAFVNPLIFAPLTAGVGGVSLAAHWHTAHAETLTGVLPTQEAANPGIVTFKQGVYPMGGNLTKRSTVIRWGQAESYCAAPIAFKGHEKGAETFWWAVNFGDNTNCSIPSECNGQGGSAGSSTGLCAGVHVRKSQVFEQYKKMADEFVQSGDYRDNGHARYFVEMTDNADAFQNARLLKGWLWFVVPGVVSPVFFTLVFLPIFLCLPGGGGNGGNEGGNNGGA
jgi:hypothetical protein